MSGNNEHRLINYLDRTLEDREMQEVEELIRTDAATRQQWQYLQLAVQAVEYAALYDQVSAVKEQYNAHQPAEATTTTTARPKVVRLWIRNAYRIAACFIFVVAAIAVFKYINTSATNMYREVYTSYSLNTSRGNQQTDALEQAYRNKNWQAVVTALQTISSPDNKALFLAGMANMELKQYAAATSLFKQVLARNVQTGDDYFLDEAEFYLAMSYLANGQTKEAIPVLQQIRSSKDHLYNEQANKMSATEWQMLKFKAGK